jgi:hypothetical protein
LFSVKELEISLKMKMAIITPKFIPAGPYHPSYNWKTK